MVGYGGKDLQKRKVLSLLIYLINLINPVNLFNIHCTNFNKIYSLVSEICKFKDCQFESQVASTGNWLPYILAAVDRVTVGTIALNEACLIIVMQCNVM